MLPHHHVLLIHLFYLYKKKKIKNYLTKWFSFFSIPKCYSTIFITYINFESFFRPFNSSFLFYKKTKIFYDFY